VKITALSNHIPGIVNTYIRILICACINWILWKPESINCEYTEVSCGSY